MPLKLILLYLILVLPHSNYIKYSCLILWISFSFRVEMQWYRKQTRATSENCWRHHVTNSITPDLAGWSNLLTMVKTPKLFICGKQLEHHGKNMTVCLHHKQVLGNVFEWYATKSCGILKIQRWKFQGSKRITLDMVQQLKVKNFWYSTRSHALPSIHNCLQKHHQCKFLRHRGGGDSNGWQWWGYFRWMYLNFSLAFQKVVWK